MEKVGWHTSIRFLAEEDPSFLEENKTYQVFIGSPRTLKIPSFASLLILKREHPDLDIVVHTPYVVSLCKNPAEKIVQATMYYYIQMARQLHQAGVKYMVTHIGGLSKGDTLKQGAIYIWDFCMKWLQATEGCDTILCLENDSGSKSGTKMGYIKILAAIVKKIDNSRIRMCYDTEHAYAAGFEITPENLDILDKYVSVVHFNAVPDYVEFGGHLDRHAETSLDESKIDLFNVYKKLFNGVRPFIFEVDGEPYISRNKKWLEEKLSTEVCTMVQVSYEITKEDYEKAKDNPYNIIGDSVKMGYGCSDAQVTEVNGHYYLSYLRGVSCE